ncbi:MAG: hypothetical protein FJW34_12145 [Acidobacteria bacterium]|nr:hypothetical protein [Acidobacteriota bacterium]
MMLTRRQAWGCLTAIPSLAPAGAEHSPAWTPEWDVALIRAAVERLDQAFDPGERMLARSVGPGYQYHTSVRGRTVHPTRDSLEYAVLLLEAGGEQRRRRAGDILARVTALQETDPGGKWYGLWGWYLEEPAPRMSPADWNWADFNGALLLLAAARHGTSLEAPLLNRMREAIRHAAYSVRRRNVTMSYTNIAVMGSFVTLAAAEMLGDADLLAYARDRLRRLARAVDDTGSFAEYNSPTYTHVTIANLTRLRMLARDEDSRALVRLIHHRAWLHLARRWHPPTRQLAGPMSRCYQTDLGAPLWLQKALGGRLAFATREDIAVGRVTAPGEVGLLDYRCPEELAAGFLRWRGKRQHREVFLPAAAPVRPVQGTTWLERDFCLGAVNRGDLWIQRRPLLAYWGGASRPARYLQLRFLKDDYDFASALFYSAQQKNCVLGLVNFRWPGGDRHGSLDPIVGGEYQAARLRLRFDFQGVAEGARILAGGAPLRDLPAELPLETALGFDLGGARLWLRPRAARFGERGGRLSVAREESLLTVSIDLLREPRPVTMRWKDLPAAYAVFTLIMEGAAGRLEDLDRRAAAGAFDLKTAEGRLQAMWLAPGAALGLRGAAAVGAVAEQDRAFLELVNGRPAPLVRLSEERLAAAGRA